MRGFNYGLLFTVGGVAMIWIVFQVAFWISDRAERRNGVRDLDVTERLARAEAAIQEANEEIAAARAELAAHQ